MTKPNQKQQEDKLGFDRLVFFSDAVLAIAITLMALEIRLPEIEPEAVAGQLPGAIAGLGTRLWVYFLSFLVIGMYWVLHHRLFRLIRTFDGRLLWLNLIFLMFIALLPASTNALGRYPEQPDVVILYAVSVLLVGLSEFALWVYAQRHLVIPEVSVGVKRYIGARILASSLVFLLSIPIARVDPALAKLTWLLMIPLLLSLRLVFPKSHRERNQLYEEES